MEKGFKKIFEAFKSYLIITIGLLCYTGGWVIFILPNKLVGGGVSGIGAIIQYATGFPVSYTFLIVNIFLLLISLKVLGKSFGFKTVYAVIIVSFFFKLLPEVIPAAFIEEFVVNGKLICTLMGGALSGLGIGLTFSQGGSTGGTDIIALMINKYRNISTGKLILIMDIFIISSSMLLPSEDGIGLRLANVVYGFLMVFVTSSTIDLFISGTKQSVQIFIFSKQYVTVADKITSVMHRGVTVLDGKGWYSKEDGKILLVVVRKSETNMVLRFIKEIDKTAFISVGSVMGVYGQGFDKIKN